MKTHPTTAMSRSAAQDNLTRFFALAADSDTVTLEQIFRAKGRDLSNEKRNKSWLFNKLTMMKPYELVIRQYSSNSGQKELTGLKLTEVGKKALGRPTAQYEIQFSNPGIHTTTQHAVDKQSEVTLESVYSAIKVLRKQMPSFEITFEIKPREDNVFETVNNTVRKLLG